MNEIRSFPSAGDVTERGGHIRLLDFLRLLAPELNPVHTKIHLASWNGSEDPLDVYRAGNFDEWQRWQTRRNFDRPFVISLIRLPPEPHTWLFAGLHRSGRPTKKAYPGSLAEYQYYPLSEDDRCNHLNGRLSVTFERPGRNSYLYGETAVDGILVSELHSKKLEHSNFPGFSAVDISHDELKTIFARGFPSWHAGLSSAAGIYLITDAKGGGLYVGIAHGQGGFWQRWSDYALTGHGGNKELRALLQANGADYTRNFRYALLEIADVRTLCEELLPRETHWKKILGSRAHGLNAN